MIKTAPLDFPCRSRGGCIALFVEPGNFVSIALQPGLHVLGYVVGIDAAAVAVAQNGNGAVIIRDDDIAAVVGHVENIEAIHLADWCQLHLAWSLAGPATGNFAVLHKILRYP